MKFNLISQVVFEAEEEDLIGGALKALEPIKQGFKNAKDRHKAALDKQKAAENDAEKKQKDAEKAADDAVKADKKAETEAEKAAEKETKKAAAEHKLKTGESVSNLRKDLSQYIKDYFDYFPHEPMESVDAEEMHDKFPTREAAVEGYKVYVGLADRLDGLMKALNAGLSKAGKLNDNKLKAINLTRAKLSGAVKDTSTAPQVVNSPALINFVQSESVFFKRLIRVDDSFDIDANDFAKLIKLKLEQTDDKRVPDAAAALNLVFGYMADLFRGHARSIKDATISVDDIESAKKDTAETEAAASVAAQKEVAAKKPS